MALLPDGSILVVGGLTGVGLNSVTYLMKCVNNPELGLHDPVSSLNGLVHPMPFSDHLSISGGLDVDGYVIRDVLGRELKQGKLDHSTADGRYNVRDILPLLAGPLVLQLSSGSRSVAASIILQE